VTHFASSGVRLDATGYEAYRGNYSYRHSETIDNKQADGPLKRKLPNFTTVPPISVMQYFRLLFKTSFKNNLTFADTRKL